ncbi:helix-turn-helix domain-containing protein, partial [Aneurinibacillus aneurinilyticus]|nr:helix-turn-helix domain-containing protein [Aneurinibacillus aneurinilyticus]
MANKAYKFRLYPTG